MAIIGLRSTPPATRSRPSRRRSRASASRSRPSRPLWNRPGPSSFRRRPPQRGCNSNSTGSRHVAARQLRAARLRAGRSQPRPVDAAVQSGQSVLDGRRPMSTCSGPSSRKRAYARRTQDRAGQGRARPVVHRHPRAGRRRVGNRAVQTGDYVQTGQRLASLVPLDEVYVEANFKETQLARCSPARRSRSRSMRCPTTPSRERSKPLARLRRRVLAAAAGQCDRKLHQDRAAAAGAHPRAGRRARRAAAARHVGDGERQHQKAEPARRRLRRVAGAERSAR